MTKGEGVTEGFHKESSRMSIVDVEEGWKQRI